MSMKKIIKFFTSSKSRRGDTIIEVTIALAVFTIIAVISMGLMDRNLSAIQSTLELNMARNEIDAQAEAIRFIHNSFLSDRELVIEDQHSYKNLWHTISESLINNPAKIPESTTNNCEAFYGGDKSIENNKAFIINTRNINPYQLNSSIISSVDLNQHGISNRLKDFIKAPLYPRVIFTNKLENSGENLQETTKDQDAPTYNQIGKIEGIWVIATRDVTGVKNYSSMSDSELKTYSPQFYDFHIRTCWYAPGQSNPTTIATIIRLYNPEYVEVEQ